MNDDKKEILITALAMTANTMDSSMRRIYDDTKKSAMNLGIPGDRMLLTDAQVEITKFALENYKKTHGESPILASMLAQLTMTRKEYNQMANMA